MLGAIIGDMVGSPYEFHPWQGAAEAFPLKSFHNSGENLRFRLVSKNEQSRNAN